ITGTSSWKKDADAAIRPTAVVKQASSTTPEKTMSPAVPREILDASDSTAAPSEYCPLSGIFVPITPSARYTISRKKPASTAAIEEYLTTVLRSVTPWALKELTTMIAAASAARESIGKYPSRMPAVSGLLAYSPVAAAGSPLSCMKPSTARMAIKASSSGVRKLARVSATLPGNSTHAKATAKKIAV